MSHIVTITTEVRDAEGVRLACQRLSLGMPTQETVRLFSGQATGLVVRLPNWQYPVVCDTANGRVQYDNFNGHWGDPAQLNAFLQAYAAEKAKLEARRRGHTVTEQTLRDDTIKLVIQVQGGTA